MSSVVVKLRTVCAQVAEVESESTHLQVDSWVQKCAKSETEVVWLTAGVHFSFRQ